MSQTPSAGLPGWEGTVGPFPDEYGQPHVYARDVQSGVGNCVCGRTLGDRRHVQAAPGVPIPEATARPAAIGYGQEHIEPIARAFHEIYERLAPEHGYKTREASAVPWAEVPANNKSLMIAVVASLVAEGRIIPGDSE